MAADFTPPLWLSNPHAQTILGRLIRPRRLVAFERESLPTPDGDELILDHLRTTAAPLHFILMHGLEGSSYSVYIQGILSLVERHGFSATAINFRSCARDPRSLSNMLPNRRPRFYHSGETEDFDFVVRTLTKRFPSSRFVAFGASLGGNALLKWLGEHPDQTLIAAAGTVSVPYDLAAGADRLDSSLTGRFYVATFLATLKKKVTRLHAQFPETRAIIDGEAVRRTKTFRGFDDAATAPLHGFKGADDYYQRSSSMGFLSRITTPTLCVSALDDPFLPPSALERARSVASSAVDFRITPSGGHVGFIGGRAFGRRSFWAEELIVEWLIDHSGVSRNPA